MGQKHWQRNTKRKEELQEGRKSVNKTERAAERCESGCARIGRGILENTNFLSHFLHQSA